MPRDTENQSARAGQAVRLTLPDRSHLRDAGPSLAMSWFLLRGLWPAVPAEPRPYDLLLETSLDVKRIQVKTTTFMESSRSWSISIGRHAGGGVRHDQKIPYRIDEVDFFVIIDGDLTVYLIPVAAVSGRLGICLRLYSKFIVGSAASMLEGLHPKARRGLRRTEAAGGPKVASNIRATSDGGQESRRALGEPDGLILGAADGAVDKLADRLGARPARWTEADLTVAVEKATSWADLLRSFGYKPSSTKPRQELRRYIEQYGISTGHFVGKRTWSDQRLIAAAAEAQTWAELLTGLGLAPTGNSYDSVLRAASRLGVSLHHLRLGPKCGPEAIDVDLSQGAGRMFVRRAAQGIATAWFLLRGCTVSTPCEPAIYDLIVDLPDGLKRVQVKSTTALGTRGSWLVRIGHRPDGASHIAKLVPYGTSELDLFFIVDGDMALYLIPAAGVAGKTSLTLRGYRRFIVGDASSLMEQWPSS